MGNRSNINFITEYRPGGEVVGLNVYLHWGGRGAQLQALLAADGPILERVSYDPGSFIQAVAGAASGVAGGWYSASLTPFVLPGAGAAYGQVLDNQHTVLAFDLVNRTIVLAEEARPAEPTITATYALDHTGILAAQEAIIPQCDPEMECELCVKRAQLEAAGLTKVEAEIAVEGRPWEDFGKVYDILTSSGLGTRASSSRRGRRTAQSKRRTPGRKTTADTSEAPNE